MGQLPSVKKVDQDLTTSTTWEDADGATIDITVDDQSDILLLATIEADGSVSAEGGWRLVFDGTNYIQSLRQVDSEPANITLVDLVPNKGAGTYTFKLQHKIASGTLTTGVMLVAVSLHNGNGAVPANSAYVASDTVGNAWEDIPGLTCDVTLSKTSHIWAMMVFHGYHSGNNKRGTFAINIDATRMEESQRDWGAANAQGAAAVSTRTDTEKTAGTYTVKGEWIGMGGTTLTGEDFSLVCIAAEADSGSAGIDIQKDVVASDSTTATALEDITGSSVTADLDETAHLLSVITLSTDVSVNNTSAYCTIQMDGTDYGVMERGHAVQQRKGSIGHVVRTDAALSSGSKTVNGRWYTDSGNTLTGAGICLTSIVLAALSPGTTFERENDDSATVTDEARYETFLHRYGDDSQALLDEARYETFLHRFGDDSVSSLDEARYETFLHRFGDESIDVVDEILRFILFLRELDDTITVIDVPRYETFLHRFGDDSQAIVDEIRTFYTLNQELAEATSVVDEAQYITFLHRFGDDAVPILDDIFTEKLLIITRQLVDIINVVDEVRYETFLHRFGDDSQTVVDEPQNITFLHRLLDDSQAIVDNSRYETFLHRFADDTIGFLDDIFTEKVLVIVRQLADTIDVLDEEQLEFILRTIRLTETVPILDEPRYTFTRHVLLSETQAVLDEVVAVLEELLTIQLVDTINVVDEERLELILRTIRLAETIPILDEPRYTFIRHQLLDDSQSVVDDPRYETFLHRFGSDTIGSLDDVQYTTFLHQLLSDTITVLDNLFTELALVAEERQLSDVINIVDQLRTTYTLHREISDTQVILDEVRYITTLQRELSESQPILDELRRTFDIRQRLADVIPVVDEPRYVYTLHRQLSEIIPVVDDVRAIFAIIFEQFLDDSITVVDEAFIEALIGLIASVFVSPDPATICDFLTVVANFVQVPSSATAQIQTTTKNLTLSGNGLIGKAVFRAFDLGFITSETVTVQADASTDTSQTATVEDISDRLNPLRNAVITALQNEAEFSDFEIVEEVPQHVGITGPTILLETIAGGPEIQGHGELNVVNATFQVHVIFPEGEYRLINGNKVEKSSLSGHFLDVLLKVLTNIDFSAFEVDSRRVVQANHLPPWGDQLIFYGCSAVLIVDYRSPCQ